MHLCLLLGVDRIAYLMSILRDMTGTPGQTFGAMLKYMQIHRPPLVPWENVQDIKEAASGANIEYMAAALEAIGYALAYRIVQSDRFLLPQRRRRAFGLAMLVDDSGLEVDVARRLCQATMQTLLSFEFDAPLSLDDMFLNPNGPFLKRELDIIAAQAAKADGGESEQDKHKESVKWRPESLRLVPQRGHQLHRPRPPDGFKDNSWLQKLSDRERKGLAFWLKSDSQLASSTFSLPPLGCLEDMESFCRP